MKLKILAVILGLILTALLIVVTLPQAGKVIGDTIPKRGSIYISLEPQYINEGQYDEIPIKIILSVEKDRNITYLELKKDNIIIDREGKNSQTKVAKNIWNWKGDYNDLSVFYCKSGGYLSCGKRTMESTAKLRGCKNCFMGEEFPYVFTFIIKYSEGGGIIKTITKEVKIPII